MGSATGGMYFLKLSSGKQFLVAIKLVRDFLGIVDKWFCCLFVGGLAGLSWVEVDERLSGSSYFFGFVQVAEVLTGLIGA